MELRTLVNITSFRKIYKSMDESQRARFKQNIEKIDLEIEIEEEERAKYNEQKEKVRDEILSRISEHGMSVDELFGASDLSSATKAPSKKIPAKYRIQQGNGEFVEWSGRGLPPKAFRDAFANGKSKNDFLI